MVTYTKKENSVLNMYAVDGKVNWEEITNPLFIEYGRKDNKKKTFLYQSENKKIKPDVDVE